MVLLSRVPPGAHGAFFSYQLDFLGSVTVPEVVHLFNEDEMDLKSVKPEWSAEDLLAQDCVFYLKDIAKVLDLETNRVKKIASSQEDSYAVIGVRKIWRHWVVRMKVFRQFFGKHLQPFTQKVHPSWDANTLLSQEGRFLLSKVCRLIPYTLAQIRYRAKKCQNSREEMGCWKEASIGRYVVDMAVFRVWIKRIHKGDFRL